MLSALRRHLPEYLMEAWALGLFMVSASLFGVVLFHPASPVVAAVPDPTLRRVLMGIAMGLTAVGNVYSPWGRRSGAHMNPAVTLTFYRLGKVAPADAVGYVAGQFVGGLTGMLFAGAVLAMWIADPAVNYVVTVPGPAGMGAAFAAELGISALLMVVIRVVSSHSRLASLTGLAAGSMVALYITVEAPISGMSMNPARTWGSAATAGIWTAWWIYFVAPPLGMLLGAELHRSASRANPCAKLMHDPSVKCIFCEYVGRKTEGRKDGRTEGREEPLAAVM